MRWHILRTLLHKEVLRHLANRGGLVLLLLLVVASMLLSFFGVSDTPGGGLTSRRAVLLRRLLGLLRRSSPIWPTHLPPRLANHIDFPPGCSVPSPMRREPSLYPQEPPPSRFVPANHTAYQASWFWHPGTDGVRQWPPFEIWFWKESQRFTEGGRLPGTPRH